MMDVHLKQALDELEAQRARADAAIGRARDADVRAAKAETERDHLRALLTRIQTSLAEATVLREVE